MGTCHRTVYETYYIDHKHAVLFCDCASAADAGPDLGLTLYLESFYLLEDTISRERGTFSSSCKVVLVF